MCEGGLADMPPDFPLMLQLNLHAWSVWWDASLGDVCLQWVTLVLQTALRQTLNHTKENKTSTGASVKAPPPGGERRDGVWSFLLPLSDVRTWLLQKEVCAVTLEASAHIHRVALCSLSLTVRTPAGFGDITHGSQSGFNWKHALVMCTLQGSHCNKENLRGWTSVRAVSAFFNEAERLIAIEKSWNPTLDGYLDSILIILSERCNLDIIYPVSYTYF